MNMVFSAKTTLRLSLLMISTATPVAGASPTASSTQKAVTLLTARPQSKLSGRVLTVTSESLELSCTQHRGRLRCKSVGQLRIQNESGASKDVCMELSSAAETLQLGGKPPVACQKKCDAPDDASLKVACISFAAGTSTLSVIIPRVLDHGAWASAKPPAIAPPLIVSRHPRFSRYPGEVAELPVFSVGTQRRFRRVLRTQATLTVGGHWRRTRRLGQPETLPPCAEDNAATAPKGGCVKKLSSGAFELRFSNDDEKKPLKETVQLAPDRWTALTWGGPAMDLLLGGLGGCDDCDLAARVALTYAIGIRDWAMLSFGGEVATGVHFTLSSTLGVALPLPVIGGLPMVSLHAGVIYRIDPSHVGARAE
ncbi:MAG: hypothetical protein JRH20_22845, partial [Deltaproteobacteria bacterium]|nr:hypothetical protein [Deltaproteobacteria bacterium]